MFLAINAIKNKSLESFIFIIFSVASEMEMTGSDRVMPIHDIGIVSIMTFHWMTSFIWHVYKKGSATVGMMRACCKQETAQVNGRR